MNNFEIKESYSHKLSKSILKEWFNNGLNLYSLESDKEQEDSISYRISDDDILFEYPLALITKTFDGRPSNTFVSGNGWGYLLNKTGSSIQKWFPDDPMTYVPSYDECINYGYNPISIVDLVIVHKGSIIFGIEICNKNPVSVEKQNKIIELYNKTNHTDQTPIFEIDSNWIMQQIKQPKKLIFKRQII